ncbi:MAG: T9SS type A sorting domain-containing protein [Bacteroidetes bacterium]|nr:MAG: T9SS type A sorting domain-containing protein [Bacteroidota bacterium]
MRKLLLKLCYCFIVFPATTNGQGIDNLWMMGYDSHSGVPWGGMTMDFSSGSMVLIYQPREMNFAMTSTIHCNEIGNVLFYSNGVYIANALNDTMMNGSGLNPGYYANVVGSMGLFIPQAALTLPLPDSESKFLLFHNTVDDSVAYSFNQYYSEIDMDLDGGLGAVVSKNIVLRSDTLMYGRLTAVKHGNGRDWWVVFHGGRNDKYYIYLVDPNGIHIHAVQQIGGDLFSAQGQVCFSPDGSKFALYDPVNDLHLMDFDRCSGIFSNHIHVAINDSAAGGGVAFSANSRMLYVSSTNYLYQLDMAATNIPSSQTTIAVWDTFYSPNPPFATNYYLAQLAPDKKIYISSTSTVLDMHLIEYPDSIGLACSFCQHCLPLPALNGTTIPNHPNYHLGALGSSICDSLPTSIKKPSNDAEDAYTIFPNPVSDKLYVRSTAQNQSVEIIIYNSLLQALSIPMTLIKDGEYSEVNTSGLVPGVYFLEIVSKGEKFVKRFVKN